MGWVFAALIVVVIGFAFLASMGRLGQMSPQIDDRPVPALPTGPLSAEDLERVGFAVVLRGYAMAQVDEVLARVADQLTETGQLTHTDRPAKPVAADELGPVPNGWPATT